MMRLVLALLVVGGAAHAAPKIIRDCPTCPDIVVVPSGQFLMGTAAGSAEVDADTGESPAVAVTVGKAFGLGKTEVTTAQYGDFLREARYTPEPGCRLWNERWLNDPKADWRGSGQMKAPRPTFPAVCVSWVDAKAYAAWLSKKTGKTYRLPTESEWEYAARAGSTDARPYGGSSESNTASLACDNANVYDVTSQASYLFPQPYARCKDNAADLAAVGSYKANDFGLHDMIGNVAEWVEDCYTASYSGRPVDQRAWVWDGGCEARALRGGAWTSRPADARSAKRQQAPAATKTTYLGFRVARDVSEDDAR